MLPPKSIRLGATKYDVTMVPMELLGETKNSETTIVIRPAQSAASMRDTVLHEVLHAVIWTSGASHALNIDTSSEESLVRVLTPHLLGVLRDNPALLRYLLEK